MGMPFPGEDYFKILLSTVTLLLNQGSYSDHHLISFYFLIPGKMLSQLRPALESLLYIGTWNIS